LGVPIWNRANCGIAGAGPLSYSVRADSQPERHKVVLIFIPKGNSNSDVGQDTPFLFPTSAAPGRMLDFIITVVGGALAGSAVARGGSG
ncbi:hypothetical protein, partial [Halalkalibacter flavus]|uniref:hypothetical protein n=1 Tax=Halalkalibacter flavus TaxID=3090668 RepID=UPI002FC5CB75